MVREEQGSDWLDFCIPSGMLAMIFSIDYHWFHETNPWLQEIDQILLRMADAVYNAAPFDLALIGADVSGWLRADEARTTDLERGGILVPSILVERLKPSGASTILSTGVHWFP
ncbi:MAG: hypothetical protein JWO59_57 [Chloroflexi bacterium]|nr:hypothetical protein [Chloroflexota bacterium]